MATSFASITNMIRMDHTHVLALFRRYRPDTSRNRKWALINNACLALEIHAKLEEEIFYPALRRVLGPDPILEKSVPEHDEMRWMIETLRSREAEDVQDDRAFRELLRNVLHHVADEETMLLPQAEELLKDELNSLGLQMTKRRMQLLAPHAGEVATTTARSFPIATAALAGAAGLGLLLLGSRSTRQARMLPKH